MAKTLAACPPAPKASCLQNAYLILSRAHDSTQSFLVLFQRSRKRKAGTTTDEEADLLRAMVLFSSAGLDAVVKQLVRDALPAVIECNPGSAESLRSYVKRRLRRGGELDVDLVSRIVLDRSPRNVVITDLVGELTGGSLQSKDEMLKVAAMFDIPSTDLWKDLGALDELFRVRNQIAHEMDVNLQVAGRKRRSRRFDDMIRLTNTALQISAAFLNHVDAKLHS